MNIFFLDNDPEIAASYYCNSHSSKMTLEFSEILSTNFSLQGINLGYKPTHANHPSTKWARESKTNFIWFIIHAFAVSAEYTRRYKKIHKSHQILQAALDNMDKLDLPDIGLTEFAIAINEHQFCRLFCPNFNSLSPVEKYREYYNYDKAAFAKWKNAETPHWFVNKYHGVVSRLKQMLASDIDQNKKAAIRRIFLKKEIEI